MNPRKLILFDYDGVLVDSIDFNLRIVSEVLSELGYSDFPTVEYCRKAQCISFEEWAKLIEMDPLQIPIFVSAVHKGVTDGAVDLRLFDGIAELLAQLNNAHQIGVITGNTSSAASTFFTKHGIKIYFSHVIGADSPGSKAEKISKIAKESNLSLEQVYYIGDAGTDIQQGKLAGAKTVAVGWGYQSRERLSLENPDYLVDSVEELARILST